MDFAFLPFTDHFLHPLIHRHSSLVKNVQGAYRKGTDCRAVRAILSKTERLAFFYLCGAA